MLSRAALLLRDRNAAVAPMVAVLAGMLLAVAGVLLDTALYYASGRELRAATEAAALAAAMVPDQADARARAYLSRNGFSPSVLQSVEVGRYCPDIAVAPQDRFDPSFTRCPGNGRATAVRLRSSAPSRRFLSSLLGPADPIPPLSATATAARIDEAGLGLTSGIVTVGNPLVAHVNGLLGALLGRNLALGSGDVAALMSGTVDAGLFFDRLAARVGETGTYSDLVARTVPLADILAAAAESARDPGTAAALANAAGQVGSGYQVPLAGLFGLGVWKHMPVGGSAAKPALRAGLNAYQLLAFAIQGGNGAIDLSDALSVVSAGSTLRIAGIARGPMDRPRFSFGPAGETRASTAALRLQLLVAVPNLSVLGNTVAVNALPVLVDVAAAEAQVTDIACPDTPEQAQDTRVTVHAASGLVNAYVGSAPANAMTSPMPPITAADIGQVRIVNLLSLVTVDARAVAQPVMGASADLAFGPGGQGRIGSPEDPGTPASVGNGSQVGPLLTSLTASLAAPSGLQVRILGLCLPLICSAAADSVRSQVLGAVVAPIGGLAGSAADPLLDSLLAALGIQLGHATVRVSGARCGVPVLV